MELGYKQINVKSESDTFKLIGFGDIHLMAESCDAKEATRVRDFIRDDPNAYFIGIGDYLDCLMPSDPRWSMRNLDQATLRKYVDGPITLDDLASIQMDVLYDFFDPIKHKCLGYLEGNHEATMRKYYHTDPVKRLASRHGAPWLGQSCLYRLHFKGNKWGATVDTYAEHGATGGGSDGNSVNNQLQRMGQFDAQIYMKGHIHKKGATLKTELGWGKNRIQTKRRWAVLTGTFLKGVSPGFTTYSEAKGYPPSEIGTMIALIRPRSGEIEVMPFESYQLVRGLK